MKKTIIFVAAVVGAAAYIDGDHHKVTIIEKQVETVKEMTPILVKPNITYNIEVFIKEEPVKVKPAIVAPQPEWFDEMINGVKFFEGFRSNAYYCCGGVKTIGYGETDKNIVALGAITEHKAADLLSKKLNSIREQVKEEVRVPLNEAQLCALTSFTFNLGRSNLKQLINGKDRLNDGNYDSINEIMPMYRMAGGKVREGLVKRRAWEVSLFNSDPQYTH